MDSQQVYLLHQKNAELEKDLAVKNRELQIEAALEKVRARTMAMQKSDELADTAVLLFEQVKSFGLQSWGCGFNIWENDDDEFTGWMSSPDGKLVPPSKISLNEHPLFIGYKESRHNGVDFYVLQRGGKELEEFYQYLLRIPVLGEEMKGFLKAGGQLPNFQIDHVVNFSHGNLIFITYEHVPEAHDIFKRFGKVFEQTYTRFLDLQKAEAQAREAQVELAVERVRAKALAMNRSEEIMQVVQTQRDELGRLNIEGIFSASIHLKQDDGSIRLWDITIHDVLNNAPNSTWDFNFRLEEMHPRLYIKRIWDSTEKYFVFEQDEHDFSILIEWVRQFKKEDADEIDRAIKEYNIKRTWFAAIQLDYGRMNIELLVPPTAEVESILSKMGAAFDLTYKRFLDLQKAEAQAREAQIQLAMERVRARTMAMQKSGELNDVAELLFKQVAALGIKAWTTGFNVWSDDNNYWTDYVTNPEGGFIEPYTIDTTKHWVFANVSEAKKKGEEFYVQCQEGEMLTETYRHLSIFADKDQFKKMLEGGFQFPKQQFDHFVFGSKVSLLFITFEPVPEAHDIFKRFGRVFEQTYTRFLDLQKAEAQAREAKIEAALERVRSRSMAMQKSEEVMDVAVTVYDQLQKLDFTSGATSAATIIIMDEKTGNMEHWLAGFLQKDHVESYQVNNSEHPLHAAQLAAWREGATFISLELSGPALESYAEEMFTQTGYRDLPGEEKAILAAQDHVVFNLAYMSHGALMWAPFDLSNEDAIILQRFAKVFEQTYTRFLDLQKVEAQAEEAQIEAALERVRTVAMTMKKPNDLLTACKVIYQELHKLGFDELRNAMINIYNDVAQELLNYDYSVDSGSKLNKIQYHSHPIVKKYVDEAKQADDAFTQLVIEGKELEDWKKFREAHGEETGTKLKKAAALYYYHYSFKTGVISISNFQPVSAKQLNILKRFRNVFNLSYQRYIDITTAEAQAREAQIQLALERVRARTMAMQHSTELGEASFLLVKQIKALNIDVWGCAFNIFNEEENNSTEWFSNEEGYQPTYKLPREGVFLRYYEAAKRGESLHIEEFAGEKCAAHYRYLSSIPVLGDVLNNYSEAGIAIPTFQIDHVTYFRQGYLLFITQKPVPESYDIFKRFAAVFEQTYTRFLELQKAEALAVRAEQDLIEIKAARKNAEDTLTELKATQAQLIQAEKMASLGELTAGIAHEIQNPLNFVNNFSEVSTELVEELKIERSKANGVRDEELEGEILNDISQNLEKIAHHGKRADAIVKGMLQHSRASTNKTEPTDINALADEYLRLSYHGFRAKDKKFNADYKTDFDESIGKIEVVQQEIGRVLLNLFNNAFYAVNERRKAEGIGYEPTVSVATIKIHDHVEVRVKDNGNGIHRDVADKVFQPFFTTKPTGQGTGLGLSLSYDIIKAHGGELKLETKEGEGAEFIIYLPV